MITIIGNGIAGDEAAFAARETDPDVQILMVTGEKHPLYSPCVLADYISGEIPRDRVFLRKKEDYRKSRIELRCSTHVMDWFPEQKSLQTGNGEIVYNKLILATGSRPIIPNLPGVKKQGVISLKTPEDADFLKKTKGKNAVVVGAGPVGIEAAVALRKKGMSVTLVELQERILPRILDTPLADSLKKQLESGGIQVLLKEQVLEILGQTQVREVQTDKRLLPADVVVLVLGMSPRKELAEKAGLRLGPCGGIAVDDSMKTSLQDVWACGDCVESMDRVSRKITLGMLWNNAGLQGKIAGSNAANAKLKYTGSLNITTIGFFDGSAASIGFLAADFPEEETQVLHRKGPSGELWLVLHENRLIGVQALGRTQRVGEMLGLLLKRTDIEPLLNKPQALQMAWQELWALRGMHRELRQLLKNEKQLQAV